MTNPTVGRILHYKARGSADGAFPSVCRAAIVTETYADDFVSLAVLNPTGLFFDQRIEHDEQQSPGTWHWPCVRSEEVVS